MVFANSTEQSLFRHTEPPSDCMQDAIRWGSLRVPYWRAKPDRRQDNARARHWCWRRWFGRWWRQGLHPRLELLIVLEQIRGAGEFLAVAFDGQCHRDSRKKREVMVRVSRTTTSLHLAAGTTAR